MGNKRAVHFKVNDSIDILVSFKNLDKEGIKEVKEFILKRFEFLLDRWLGR